MSNYESLKKIWKKLGIKAHVKNFSSQPLWVLENEDDRPVAHLLRPMTKSPIKIDTDAFRRRDGKPIEGHKSWWKIYDGSTAEVFDKGKDLSISVITKTAVEDKEFSTDAPITYEEKTWGTPILLVTNVQRDKKKSIIAYLVTNVGWIEPEQMLTMTCHHEIDNARPVFPTSGTPFIRTRRDQKFFNNLSTKGLV